MEVLSRFNAREIAKPLEKYSSQLLWHLGQDPLTKTIAEKLHFTPPGIELDFILRATRRNTNSDYSLSKVGGRSADFTFSPESVLGTNYDTIEIAGFGWENFRVAGTSFVAQSATEPIQLPSEDNFARKYPSLVRTIVVDGETRIILSDEFSFSGGYTRDQALKKVATTLFFVEKLSEMNKPPFLVPVPVAIGIYPTVRDDKNNPAYFIAWRVPYEGKRSGTFVFRGTDKEKLTTLRKLANDALTMSSVLLFIHDNFGLTHNQPHPGNFFVPEGDNPNTPPYLADFSTVYPFSNVREDMSRTQDIAMLIIMTFRTIRQLVPVTTTLEILFDLYTNTMKRYLGEGEYNIFSLEEPELGRSINTAIQIAMLEGRITKTSSTIQSWQQIQQIKDVLEKATAA